ncbi:hypothetical protein BST81_05715 [Leptolyngbya sp. 'hensonii']|uniref:hypothetical protein n=1 Tax=Leptolyngbya sp. 'hensonii' TaxID=1922337 RepID=UPI00094FD665|nr:hypothetical protein [Leptolyngbya sp. 'hensonii']OLP19258.1 hypothetical protein BST81_05715 [Leptolyngbya sp. 'hensonii']
MQSLIRWSILPILLIGEGSYFVAFLGAQVWFTGTSSGMYATRLICQNSWDLIFLLDSVVLNGVILVIWIARHRTPWINRLRLLCLCHIAVLRFWAIQASTEIVVKPFVP